MEIFLARHGETEWSASGKHTGLTDLPLTPVGRQNATGLRRVLRRMEFAKVFTSPLIRARETAALAGFPDAEVFPDLVEWDYGAYEGRTTKEIRVERPGWYLFQDGCPGGESPGDVGRRADRVIAKLHDCEGNILLFSHGHFLRVLGARWLGLDASAGRFFYLATAALSAIGFEHGDEDAVIRLWNDCRHVTG